MTTAEGGHVGLARIGWKVMFAYWLAQFAVWLALLTPNVMTVAVRVSELAGPAHKAEWLGWIMGIGAICAMVSAPLWGVASDRTRSRIGKRKPWIIAGGFSLLGGLWTMAVAADPIMLGFGWVICQIGSNAAQAAFNAVMSDIVPEEQHGTMSALLGTSPMAAIMCGVFLTRFTIESPMTMFLLPWLLAPFAIIWFVAVVPNAAPSPRHSYTPEHSPGTRKHNPLAYPDFNWALGSRFLVNFAYAFALTYQVYFMTDHLRIPSDRIAEFMASSTSLMGVLTLILSLTGGWLSDRFRRRKPFVIAAAAMLATGLFGMAFATGFADLLWAVALISVGVGLYLAVDVALCVEVLPNRTDAARDMGIFQIANSLPQSLAPVTAPTILAMGAVAGGGANYPLLFVFAAGSALIGALAIVPIRGVR